MSEFRDLQAKLQKIEEGYYSDLDIDLQELRIANKTLSPVELVSLARQRFGQDAATYLSNQLETEGDVRDYRKRNQTYFKEEGGKDEFLSRLKGEQFVKGDKVCYIPQSAEAMGDRGEGCGTVVGMMTNDQGEPNVAVEWDDDEYSAMARLIHPVHLRKTSDDEEQFGDWLKQNPFESIDEDMFGEETYDDMVEYWKGSLSRSIVTKGVFTQLYDAANQNIEELNAAIEDQAHSIAETYHGSGEGIGTSDQNHFVASIARQLGIDDLFGWRKPKVEEDMRDLDDNPFGNQYGMADFAHELKGVKDDYDSDPVHDEVRAIGARMRKASEGLGEDLHSEDPISVQIKSLLAQGKKVMSRIGGATGEIVSTDGRLVYIKIRGSKNPAVTSFDSKDNVEIVGNIDHYDVIEHLVFPDEVDDVDEGKYDYPQGMKGKGAAYKEPGGKGQKGSKNRKNRKAFRKAEKAKAHQARMRGEVDEEFELDEARGRVVEVPPELRGSDAGNATGATSRDAERFLADLGPDDDVSHDVVDPETGELLDWPTKGLNRDEHEDKEDAAYWRAQGGTKREKGKRAAKNRDEFYGSFNDVPILHLSLEGPGFGEGQDIAGQFLNELRDSDFYNVVWRDISDDVEDPEMMRDNDYDIDVEVPVLLKRKDGKKLTHDDHDNIKEIMKAVKLASTLGNIGIGYAGTTDEGTTARFHTMFH